MNEREQSLWVAQEWLNFKMNSLVQMVPGDPDCDAVALARSYVRALEKIGRLTELVRKTADVINSELKDVWPEP